MFTLIIAPGTWSAIHSMDSRMTGQPPSSTATGFLAMKRGSWTMMKGNSRPQALCQALIMSPRIHL